MKKLESPRQSSSVKFEELGTTRISLAKWKVFVCLVYCQYTGCVFCAPLDWYWSVDKLTDARLIIMFIDMTQLIYRSMGAQNTHGPGYQ